MNFGQLRDEKARQEARWIYFQEAIARAFEGLHAASGKKCTCPGCAELEAFDTATDERNFDAFFLKQLGTR